jgi:hypothetical protein
LDSEFAPNGIQGHHVSASCDRTFVGDVLVGRFFPEQAAQSFNPPTASTFGRRFGDVTDRSGGVCMHLKMFVLSGAAVTLWLTPLTVLDKKVSWHKAVQGLSLCGAIACAVSAGNIAHKLADEAEIEVYKERAIKADIVDEISTETYISQQQRQQEAELILASSTADLEAKREALEAIYDSNLQDSTSTSEHPNYPVYLEVSKSMKAGKSATWIVENILKMGGRKFADGKVKLEAILKQFEDEEK